MLRLTKKVCKLLSDDDITSPAVVQSAGAVEHTDCISAEG